MVLNESIPEPLHKITERPVQWPTPGTPSGIMPILTQKALARKPGTIPPHPQISQVLTAIPLGFQMAFNQLTSPTPYGNVIDSYRIYRNTSANSFSGAALIRTITHDATHQGAVVVQDQTGGGKTYFYFVTSVDTFGQESAPGAFLNGAGSATSQNANPNIAQAVGSTSNPTTVSASYVTIPEMTVTLTTKGNKLLIIFSYVMISSTVGYAFSLAFFRDGSQVSADFDGQIHVAAATSVQIPASLSFIDIGATAASHTFDMRWKAGSGSPQIVGIERTFQVVELG